MSRRGLCRAHPSKPAGEHTFSSYVVRLREMVILPQLSNSYGLDKKQPDSQGDHVILDLETLISADGIHGTNTVSPCSCLQI